MRSRRGKNSKGHKITGFEFVGNDRVLVSTTDSRIRMYNLSNYSESCKYRGGFSNESSRIRAGLSPLGQYIIAGSEDKKIYVWNTNNNHQTKGSFFSRRRNDRCETVECFQGMDIFPNICIVFFDHNTTGLAPPPGLHFLMVCLLFIYLFIFFF